MRSLSPEYQRDIDADTYEVIVVDNGSPEPLADDLFSSFGARIRSTRIDSAPASPAHAANVGISMAAGSTIGLIVDGARIASPGLLATAVRATAVAPRPVVATLGWHLGPVRHMDAAAAGYDQSTEDELLAGCDWEADGYRLFELSTLGGSSAWGWFAPVSESSALFMPKPMWDELGGLDEGFDRPGGGLVNHDLYRRACRAPGAELVVLLGEGTFHQIHGGAATSGAVAFEELQGDYVRLRGERYESPTNAPLFVGRVPPEVEASVADSVGLAARYRARRTR